VLLAKLGVTHTLGILFKVLSFRADLLGQFRIGCLSGPERGNQFFDFSLIQQILMDQLPESRVAVANGRAIVHPDRNIS
jgi:hypothetical protein